jgi:pyrimidine deaminase RibD-like protein
MKDSVETRMQKMLSAKFASADSNTNLTKNVMVGSVATDKAKILGKEFDMLFGLADSCEGPPPLEAVENADEVKPEAVFSLGSNKKAGSEGQSAIL